MNYAHFAEYIRELESNLARFGVPISEAASISKYVEVASIAAEAKERKDNQLILDFNTHGSKALSERHRVSDRTIRDWRTKILRKKIGSNVGA